MRLLITLVLISALSGCQVVELLKPSDPCAKIFEAPYHQMECRVEQGIALEYDLIKAKAKSTLPGDLAGKARLQKRLDKVNKLKIDQRTAGNLFATGNVAGAETQLELLITALEAIK